MERELEKGDLLYTLEGCQVWSTVEPDAALLEWESPQVGALAAHIEAIVREHALFTNFSDRISIRQFVLRRVDLLPLTAVAHCDRNDTLVRFEGKQGSELDPEAAARVPGASSAKVEVMKDSAAQVVRSLRGHLARYGVAELAVRLHFGIGPQGECLLHLVNPLECQLGTKDLAMLATQLQGGEPQ